MIVRKLADLLFTQRHVTAPNWESTRLLLASDGMSFSMHVTRLYAGRETRMWYRHHLEAVYCVEGRGDVVTLSDGRRYSIEPGTLYALNKSDEHILRPYTEMVCVCVFNPPLKGREVHDENGVYAVDAEPVHD